MLTYNITNWVETQKNLKWRQALRIATQNPDRWTRKAAEWNPVLTIPTKTRRRAGRPAKRWEDDLNGFVKDEETEATQSNLKTTIHANYCEHLRMGEERKTIHQTRFRRLRNPTQKPSNNTTSPATLRRRPSALQFITDSSNTTTKTQCSSLSSFTEVYALRSMQHAVLPGQTAF